MELPSSHTKIGNLEISKYPVSSASTFVPSSTEEEKKFGDIPVECVCIHCKKPVSTQVELHSSWLTFLLVFIFFCVFGWMSFCLLPLFWPLFQDSVHTCPRCMNVISRGSRIGIPSIRNEVITVKCGSCAVVLSRKYFIVCIFMIFLISVFYVIRIFITFVELPEMQKGEDTDLTWEDFVEKCGSKNSLGNILKNKNNFEKYFYRKNVKWNGLIKRIYEGFFKKNIMELYMNHQPNRLTDNADLSLLFNPNLIDRISDLSAGDFIQFEATLTEYGKRGNPHFGVLWNFTILHKFDEKKDETNEGNFIRLEGYDFMNPISSILLNKGMNIPGRIVIIRSSPFYFSSSSMVFHSSNLTDDDNDANEELQTEKNGNNLDLPAFPRFIRLEDDNEDSVEKHLDPMKSTHNYLTAENEDKTLKGNDDNNMAPIYVKNKNGKEEEEFLNMYGHQVKNERGKDEEKVAESNQENDKSVTDEKFYGDYHTNDASNQINATMANLKTQPVEQKELNEENQDLNIIS